MFSRRADEENAGVMSAGIPPYCFDELQEEFAKRMEIPYLARWFMNRFLRGTDRFDLEHLR